MVLSKANHVQHNFWEFLEDITEALDNGKYVDLVYLEFNEAFDKKFI